MCVFAECGDGKIWPWGFEYGGTDQFGDRQRGWGFLGSGGFWMNDTWAGLFVEEFVCVYLTALFFFSFCILIKIVVLDVDYPAIHVEESWGKTEE